MVGLGPYYCRGSGPPNSGLAPSLMGIYITHIYVPRLWQPLGDELLTVNVRKELEN
jgi:hypothetical protein